VLSVYSPTDDSSCWVVIPASTSSSTLALVSPIDRRQAAAAPVTTTKHAMNGYIM